MQPISVLASSMHEGGHDVGKYRPVVVPGREHAPHVLHDRDGWLELLRAPWRIPGRAIAARRWAGSYSALPTFRALPATE